MPGGDGKRGGIVDEECQVGASTDEEKRRLEEGKSSVTLRSLKDDTT